MRSNLFTLLSAIMVSLPLTLASPALGHSLQCSVRDPDAVHHNSSLVERNAITDPSRRWRAGVIPYVIDPSSSGDTDLINKAMKQFHDNTCIKFVPRTSEPNYLNIFKGQGCYTSVGMSGGQQAMSLGDGCAYIGTIVHELNHAVGFFHEHNRSDRDDYVHIFWENFQQGMQDQYRKLPAGANRLYNAFDYDSIMIHGEFAFSRDPRSKTMADRKGIHQMTEPYEKQGLSVSDIDRIKWLYQC